MKKLILSVLLTSQVANAGIVQVCPSLSAEGNELVSGIRTLRESLNQTTEECKSIADRLGLVNQVVGSNEWKSFKKVLTGSDVESLESEEVEALTTLTSEVSESLVETVKLLNGSGRECVADKDKAGFLSVLSGVTKEVSTVAGAATGPYGMAITLGGNVLSSAISGIDTFFKSNKVYNFNNKDEELLFMNQFCSFVETQKDISDFINMDTRVEELDLLDNYLNKKLEDLHTNCAECSAYSKVYAAKVEADKVIAKIIADASIKQKTTQNGETFSRCSEIARAIHAPESDLESLMMIYETYQNPLMSVNDAALISQVLEARNGLKEVYPSLSDCWKLDQDEKVKISRQFNELMRDDILGTNATIFNQQLTDLKARADKKYADKLGDYTAKSHERQAWTKVQRDLVKDKLAEPNRQKDVAEVRREHEILEARITGRLLPSYMSFIVKRNKKNIKAFRKSFLKFRKKTLSKLGGELGIRLRDLSHLTEELKTSTTVDGRFFLSGYRRTFDNLSIAVAERKTIARYCEYLVYTSTITPSTRSICENDVRDIDFYFDQLKSYQGEIDSLVAYEKWANENLNLQSTRIRDYSDLIRSWNNRGDLRWGLKDEAPSTKLSLRERLR